MTTPAGRDPQPGVLYLVATPIGNIEDLSPRAARVLGEADIVACEDTRHTGLLLSRLEIKAKRLLSLHEHNEARRSGELVEALAGGASAALVSDAGYPAVSDPGARAVAAAYGAGLTVRVIPGASSAVLTALAGSGLPPEPFTYMGFLPVKKGRRERELGEALARDHTTVFFESPHRILSTLQLLASLDPDRQIVVARELTKKFETFHRGTAPSLLTEFESRPPKGEITLLTAGTKLPKWFSPAGGAPAG